MYIHTVGLWLELVALKLFCTHKIHIHVYTDTCRSDSPAGCRAVGFAAPGYSAGQMIRIYGGHQVSKSTDIHSCPDGYKIWSPRNKKDWETVYNAMGKSKNNYPANANLIVDVTHASTNKCGGCGSQAMQSNNAAQNIWQTTDGSAWWMRDTPASHSNWGASEPSSNYGGYCYLRIDKVEPDNVQFKSAKCETKAKDYLCQPIAEGISNSVVVVSYSYRCNILSTNKQTCTHLSAAICASGSPEKCKVAPVPAPGYSAGKLVRVHHGKPVSKNTDKNSCPDGYKIWSPRTKDDWTIVYYAMGKDIGNYPKKDSLIIDVTNANNGCGGCGTEAMNSGNAKQSVWKTSDKTDWWLRDTKHNTKPSNDYQAGCYLRITNVDPDDVQFEHGDCGTKSSEYLCQPIASGKSQLYVHVATITVNLADELCLSTKSSLLIKNTCCTKRMRVDVT